MATTKDGPELHPTTVELAQGTNYGSITTVLPRGNLQTHPVWVHTDGVRRRKYKDAEHDPRVTLTIRDEENPYRYAEARGRVVETVRGREARENIDELSRKYHGRTYDPKDIKSERVMLWIVPDRQTVVGPGEQEGSPAS